MERATAGPDPAGARCRRRGRRALWLALLAVAPLLAACPKPGSPTASAGGSTLTHQVTLREGGRVVALDGDVTYGTAKELLRLIKENPQVSEIHLTSDGGLVHPALAVANAIQLRRATVFVPESCISACTLLFLGGARRYVAPEAELGFHRAFSNLDAPETAGTRLTNEQIRRRLLERGVSADFAAHVLATPGSEVWYPTTEEMIAAGVVHAVATAGALPQE